MKLIHKAAASEAHKAWQDFGFEKHTLAEARVRQQFYPQKTLDSLGEVALSVLWERVRLATRLPGPIHEKELDSLYGWWFFLNK